MLLVGLSIVQGPVLLPCCYKQKCICRCSGTEKEVNKTVDMPSEQGLLRLIKFPVSSIRYLK